MVSSNFDEENENDTKVIDGGGHHALLSIQIPSQIVIGD